MKTEIQKSVSRLIRRRFRESIMSDFGEGILANTKNGVFVVEAGDFSVGRKLLESGEYCFDEIQWLAGMLDPFKSSVVVVGSHIGSVLVPLSKHCKKVVAFEADVKNYTLLSYNLALNHCENVNAHNLAVGEKNGIVKIKRNLINTGNTSIATAEKKIENTYSEAEMVTLDDVIELNTIDLMIMDIEGYEPQALVGASEVLEKTSMLYIEFAPEQLADFDNDPLAEIELLFSKFSFAYAFAYTGKVQSYDQTSCVQWLKQNMDRRGFLCNLLFTKERLE